MFGISRAYVATVLIATLLFVGMFPVVWADGYFPPSDLEETRASAKPDVFIMRGDTEINKPSWSKEVTRQNEELIHREREIIKAIEAGNNGVTEEVENTEDALRREEQKILKALREEGEKVQIEPEVEEVLPEIIEEPEILEMEKEEPKARLDISREEAPTMTKSNVSLSKQDRILDAINESNVLLRQRIDQVENRYEGIEENIREIRIKIADEESRVTELTRLIVAREQEQTQRTRTTQTSFVEPQEEESTAQRLKNSVGRSIRSRPRQVPVNARAASSRTNTSTSKEIARVSKEEAFLLSGPANYRSVLANISRSEEVLVEKRLVDWYRVVASDGTRGWIHSSVLIFPTEFERREGKGHSTVRIQGYQAQF